MPKKRKTRYWLFKEEPSCYSIDTFEAEGQTVWDGVTNNLAQKNLRETMPGDRVLFYHSGKIKAVVGEMKVIGEPRPSDEDERKVVVDVQFVRRLPNVTLAQIKEEESLREWDLVRISRLSVVATTREQWDKIMEMAMG